MSEKMGRPRIEIDWEQAAELAKIFCTVEEICNILRCSVDTLDRRSLEKHGVRFAVWLKQFADQGRASLRRTQYVKALQGNVPLLIWLGKNELGQADKSEITGEVKVQSFTDMIAEAERKRNLLSGEQHDDDNEGEGEVIDGEYRKID